MAVVTAVRNSHRVKRAFLPGVLLALILFFFLSATPERGASSETPVLHLVYSNDVGGYLEPCG